MFEEFGVFVIYVLFVGFMVIFVIFRYEYVIVFLKEKLEVDVFCVGIILIIFVILLFFLVVGICFGKDIVCIFGESNVVVWIYFVLFLVFFLGVYNVFNYCFLWFKYYKVSVVGKVVMLGSNVISNVLLGELGFIKFGLIFGNFLLYLIFIVYLFKKNKCEFVNLDKLNCSRVYEMLRRYSLFFFENFFLVVVNGMYNNGKVFLILLFVFFSFIGYLSLVLRVL